MIREPAEYSRRPIDASPAQQVTAQVRSLLAVGLKPRDVAERLGLNLAAVLRVLHG